MNIIAILVAALVPLSVGFVWYHPKVMGNIWMKECGFTMEYLKASNMALILGLSSLFAFILAFVFPILTIHQMGVSSVLMNALEDPARQVDAQKIADLFTTNGIYADEFRTFKHGAFHGILYTIFLVLPVIGTNALFERRSFKYIAIHVGYWAISFALMGGIISAWK